MEITEIKVRLSLQTVLKHYEIQPDRNGMLRCPFHADDMASMKVYPQTNTFDYFDCGRNGDQIDLKQEATEKAIKLVGIMGIMPIYYYIGSTAL